MKGPVQVEFIRTWQKAPHNPIKEGHRAKLAPELAKKLISEGYVKLSQHKDEFDDFINEKKVEHAIEVIEKLPEDWRELIVHIKTLTNKDVLEELTQDKRKSVREAAFNRLENI